MNAPPPTKLFREEAQAGAIECPACGAPITLRGFGGAEQVACSYCGTVCKPEHDGNLDILQRAERQRRPSILPLHKRCTLDDTEWEIIGITWREVVSMGMTYPWQEFLLFNPYAGYRWLIYQMSDGQWSFGGGLDGAVKVVSGLRPEATWEGDTYKHFSSANARTTYVEGEFPWRVLANDVAQANDYICPPKLVSIEVQATEHGQDVNFTQMRPIEASEVWRAFQMPGNPPPTRGVHPAAPNPHQTWFYKAAFVVLMILWLVAVVGYVGGRDNEVVYNASLPIGGNTTETLEFGTPGVETNLEFEFVAGGMTNSWAFADVLLVDAETEEAVSVPLEVDAWSGVEDGESWSEGTNPKRVVIGGVEGGKYILQVATQVDPGTTFGSHKANSLNLEIKRDVPLGRYTMLPFLVILAFPIVNFIRKKSFESQRWSTSDHAE